MLTTFSGTVGGQLRQVLLYLRVFSHLHSEIQWEGEGLSNENSDWKATLRASNQWPRRRISQQSGYKHNVSPILLKPQGSQFSPKMVIQNRPKTKPTGLTPARPISIVQSNPEPVPTYDLFMLPMSQPYSLHLLPLISASKFYK
jgi:hypothetical protein